MTIRTMRIEPRALLDLFKSITQGDELLIDGEPIPAEAAVGSVGYDAISGTFVLEVVARFGDVDKKDIEFKYSPRIGPNLGATRALTAEART